MPKCDMAVDNAGVDLKIQDVNLLAGEQKTEEYKKKNPLGKVPVLEHDGFFLPEGAAILTYIAETNNLSELYPSDPKERAAVNRWLHWNHTGARKLSYDLLAPVVFYAKPGDDKEAILKAGHEKNAAMLEFLEKHLEGNKFLVGDKLTLADMFVAPEVDQMEFFSLLDLGQHYPNIKRWLNDCSETKGYATAADPVKAHIASASS
eukprot:CAMPEP_0174260958 /NCGR_PEP_ID=MMETSP0439-20130205/11105_1 /TAXON_ID=0 /ORGANISM="Stereomyxa ramosa, Strain Chinc5" /LENGTH=204 /DNA_ID=CAMNT_0015345351 /DNA_START=58 /DNA_END=673 /DNA_ORIENTATION=+